MHSKCIMTPGSGKALQDLKASCSGCVKDQATLKLILDSIIKDGKDGLLGFYTPVVVKENKPVVSEIKQGRIRIFYIIVNDDLIILDAWYKKNQKLLDFERKGLKKKAKNALANIQNLSYLVNE